MIFLAATLATSSFVRQAYMIYWPRDLHLWPLSCAVSQCCGRPIWCAQHYQRVCRWYDNPFICYSAFHVWTWWGLVQPWRFTSWFKKKHHRHLACTKLYWLTVQTHVWAASQGSYDGWTGMSRIHDVSITSSPSFVQFQWSEVFVFLHILSRLLPVLNKLELSWGDP